MGKHAFFRRTADLCLALTYADVLLVPSHSEVMPEEAELETKFSRNTSLKVPVVSAAMDTITESRMAIAMAQLGGLGIIHRNLTQEAQAREVTRVKFYLNGLIERPIIVRDDETVQSVLDRRRKKGYQFHSFPVLDADDRLVGLFTRTDFEFCSDTTLLVRSIMTKDLVTASQGTSMDDAYTLMKEARKKVLPLIDRNGRLAGLYVFSDLVRIRSGGSKHNVDSEGRLRVGAAVGTGQEALDRVYQLSELKVDVVVIDTAHADSKPVFETLAAIKKSFSGLEVVVGNVSTGDAVRSLIKAGADGIKVGQGAGSICTTRLVAGIGFPQLTAVYNCVQVAEGSGVPICADGGILYSGDITKAIGVGAHTVMLGNLLAGTKEAPGEIVRIHGVQYKDYRGMGSLGALQESSSSRNRYSQSGKSQLIPEGVEGVVPYRGPAAAQIELLIGGLRSGMGYVGASTIEMLRQKADFMRLSEAGLAESHVRGVTVTKEAPNYPGREEVAS